MPTPERGGPGRPDEGPPPATVLQAIESILSAGEPAELPAEVWQALHQRRAQATRLGPWIEAHHRPGRRLE